MDGEVRYRDLVPQLGYGLFLLCSPVTVQPPSDRGVVDGGLKMLIVIPGSRCHINIELVSPIYNCRNVDIKLVGYSLSGIIAPDQGPKLIWISPVTHDESPCLNSIRYGIAIGVTNQETYRRSLVRWACTHTSLENIAHRFPFGLQVPNSLSICPLACGHGNRYCPH